MPHRGPSKNQILRTALGPGSDCLPVEQLEKLIDGKTNGNPPPSLALHVETCLYCRTELDLLQRFQSDETETEEVQLVMARLRSRLPEILTPASASPQREEPWWKAFWTVRWLSPAVLTMAGILVVVAIGLQWRQAPPALRPAGDPAQDVMRSNAIAGIVPAGDLEQVPNEIRWEPARGAVKYEARIIEVDGTELWKAETSESRIGLPASVQARIVPAKTLLCQVSAFDATGHNVGDSELVRFRVLQNLYKR